jgi:LuxR family transcriptional regulator, maltose regulon positive regulatory protein
VYVPLLIRQNNTHTVLGGNVAARKQARLAKLTRPRMHGAILRERLFTLLDAKTQQAPVVWITGPPGAGKTSLLASYVEARDRQAIWYQLDAGDVDISAFFHYLARAAQPFLPRWLSLPRFSPELASDPVAFGRAFFRELYAAVAQPFLLVLDNYQDIADGAALHRVIKETIEEIPAEINLIVLSRSLPPTPLARHAAHGKLVEVGFDELKLTLDEALDLARGRDLSDRAIVHTLHARTDGWAAGLTLLLEHTKRHGPAQQRAARETPEQVFQYFAGEIFDAAAPEDQQSLMHMAFLPLMTAKSAKRISANPNAYKILESLHQRQLFVERRLADETTYQFHALFREFLLVRAQQFFSAHGLRQMQRRAGTTLLDAGAAEQAIDLFLQAQDWRSARQAITRQAPQLFAAARWTTLDLWISRLPAAELAEEGWLQFWQGMAKFAQQPLRAQEQLATAYATFGRAHDRLGQMLACSGALRAYHSNIHGEFPAIDDWIAKLIRLLQEDATCLAASQRLDVYASLLHALLYRQPNNAYLQPCEIEVLRLIDNTSINAAAKGFAAGIVINYFCVTQNEAPILQVVSALRSRLEQTSPEHFTDLYLWYYYGLYCQSTGNYTEARRCVDQTVAMAERFGERRMVASGRWFQQINAVHDRNLAELERVRTQLAPQGNEGKAIHLFALHNVNASIAQLRGNTGEAVRHVESWRKATQTTELKLFEADVLTPLAAAYFNHGALDEALALAQQGRTLTAGTCLREMYIQLSMIAGVVQHLRGNRSEARAMLQEFFGSAVPFTWGIHLFPNDLLARACGIALQEGIAVDAAKELIRRYRWPPPSASVDGWPWEMRVRTLGKFELTGSDGPLTGGRKVQRKPLELLKALIAFGCRDVQAQRLVEALWPELDGDAAMAAFHTTLLRLRKLLKQENLLLLQDGKLSLDTARCWVDTLALQETSTRIERAADGRHPDAQLLLGLYRGDFLAQEEEAPWLLSTRERLRQRFLSSVARLGQRLESQQDWQSAIEVYKKALEANNLAEDVYRRLMHCQTQQGHHAEAIDTYRRCRDLLSIVLTAKPSAETDALYQEIRQRA